MKYRNIILLNGTSSSGKTTIAGALQDVLEEPYLHTGIDQFLIEHLPDGLLVYSDESQNITAEGWLATFCDGALSRVDIGPLGYQWIQGMYRAVAALVTEGLNVIQDDVIYDRHVLEIAVQSLPAKQVFFVGVHCPLEVAEAREQARERAKGGARTFYSLVHRHGLYDLEVDSSKYSAMECALQIKAGLQEKPDPTTFQQLQALR